jgi:hypothetical protein
MARSVQSVVVLAFLAMAQSAAAQTPAPVQTAVPTRWYAGINFGTAAVEKYSGVFGLEGGWRIFPDRPIFRHFDAVGELTWTGNVVTGRQVGVINTLAGELGRLQSGTATGAIKVPAFYAGLGLRYMLDETATFKPYVILTLGGTKTKLKPTLTLNGNDVTGSSTQFGVTLGRDVIGEYNNFTASYGAGFIVDYLPWYFDLGLRVASIHEDDETANAARLVIGGGYRF